LIKRPGSDSFPAVFKEFVGFLKQYGVIGLAIAVIIGGKANELVTSIVNDLLMPLVFQPALRAANVDDIRKLSFHGILYGKVIGTAIDFTIVAFVVFLFAKFVLREENVAKK
jgi:large conductance mechanosensitive channel